MTINRLHAFKLPPEDPFTDYTLQPQGSIQPLSLIGVFVGPNNSGKSRFLRALFALDKYSYAPTSFSPAPFFEILSSAKERVDRLLDGDIMTIGNVSSGHLDQLAALDQEFLSPDEPLWQVAEARFKKLANASGGSMQSRWLRSPGADSNQLAGQLRTIGEESLANLREIHFDPGPGGTRRYYLPILRGTRPFDVSQSNFYKDRTQAGYFAGGKLPQSATVCTGIELYNTIKGMLLGEPAQREAVCRLQGYRSEKFVAGRDVTLIPREGDTTVHVNLGSEPQLPIYSLGDGLQSLIVVLFNVFTESSRSLFLIEEPDMFMHPAFQRAYSRHSRNSTKTNTSLAPTQITRST